MENVITRNELETKIVAREPLVLLEALPEPYYQKGHLPGARLFPHDRVRELAASVIADKHADVVVYCASDTCQNSHIAAAQLRNLGYTSVRVYAGGKADWEHAGLAFER
jgi:rhodanese-related sulfurtransferase